MPRGGHNRKPQHLKVLEGTARADRETPDLRPVDEELRPPEWLSEQAKSLWNDLGPKLQERGLLTPLDTAAFAALCSEWAVIQKCREIIAVEGMTVEGAGGKLKKHPALTILNQASSAFKALAVEFGLTPNSRMRLGVEWGAGEEEDPMEAFLRRRP